MSAVTTNQRTGNYKIIINDAMLITYNQLGDVKLKMAKNQGKTKKHSEIELLLFENYLLSSSTSLSKITKGYSKKCTKTSASRLYD